MVPREKALQQKLNEKVETLGIGSHERHIFLCADPTTPKCASPEAGLASWDHLKQRLSDEGLATPGKVYRTKANCLRVCVMGPIAVVYPEGVWYHSCTPEFLDKVIDQHLVGGTPLEENRISAGAP